MDINPWQVDNIQEFYFLKCPECDFMHKEESDFQNHAVENHPLSVTFFGEVDMTIEKFGIFDDHSEENESNNALNTVTEEILETRNDDEIHQRIFQIENEVKQEVQDSEECQMSEISQNTDVAEVQEPPTIIPLLTYEYAAAQIAHAIPARESREILDEDPSINNDVRLDLGLQIPIQPSSSNLVSPLTVKNGKKKFECSKCDASFTRKPNLKKHVEVIHEGKKVNKCSICDSIFNQSKALKRHIASVHEGQKPFKCFICDASFAHSGTLKAHVASIHEGKKHFKCVLCDASFTLKQSLDRHISSVHEGKKSIKCVICDASFTQSANLSRHIAAVHEKLKPFKCSICNASFTQSHHLKKHCLTVHKNINQIETVQIE